MIGNILTIFIYAVVYSISLFLFSVADRTSNSVKLKNIIIIAVLLLAFFASLRNFEVGTDTNSTLLEYFDIAGTFNSIPNILYSDLAANKIVFIVISKIIKMIGLGERVFLFIMEILVLAPIAAIAYIRKNRNSITSTMLFFLFLYYQLSFNWIRQCISASFLLLAIVVFCDGRKKNALIFAIISVLFHTSALLGIIMFTVAWISSNSNRKFLRRFLIMITVLATLILMRYWQTIALYLINQGILPASYRGYVNVFSGAHGQSYKGWFVIGTRTYIEYFLRILFFCIPSIIVLRSNGERMACNEKYRKEFYFFRMCSFLSVLIYSAGLIGLHTAYVNRITCYLDFANILYFGFACRKAIDSRRLVYTYYELCVFLLCIVYNIWLYYVLGWHATVPFYF